MEQHSIHHDKRLHTLDAERLKRLTQLADRLSKSPENQRMPVFLSIMQEMRSTDLSFTQDEQELLFSVLIENMNESDRKKAIMIRQLSSKMNTNGK